MMNKRERWLAIAVLSIVGTYGAFLVVQRLFMRPLDSQASLIKNLTTDIATKQKEMDRAIEAAKQLAQWEQRSLPRDERTAQSMYQEFLFKLMREARFEEGGTLTVQKIQKGRSYTIIPFTINGKMTLDRFSELIYRFNFHKRTILHELRSATISRSSDSNDVLNITLSVAGLSLPTAPDRDRLVPEGDDQSESQSVEPPHDVFKLISSKNIFEPHKEPIVQAPAPPPPAEPVIDATQHVVVSGFTNSGAGPEVWVYNRLTNENKVFRPGDQFDVAGIKGVVTEVSAKGIVLTFGDKEWSVKLGRNLKDLIELRSLGPSTGSEPTPEPSQSTGVENAARGPVREANSVINPDESSVPRETSEAPNGGNGSSTELESEKASGGVSGEDGAELGG